MDDEDRENEGDLVMAASKVRPEDVNFMARYGRGLICLTLTRDRCRQLRLPLMVSETDLDQTTNFTVSIERRRRHHGHLRLRPRHTIRTAVAPDARPSTCASRATSFRSWRSRAACSRARPHERAATSCASPASSRRP